MEHKPGTFRTSIGGQALIEGILMRGPEKQAIVVRSPEGLVTKVEELTLIKDKYPILGLPILRGAVTFLDSMIRGVKALMFSADYFPDDEAAQPSKLDLWLEKHVPAEKLQNVLVWVSVLLSLGMTLVLFMLLPTFVAGLFRAQNAALHNLIEGVIKVAIFLAYLILCSKQKDVRRVFCYHGAEHKTIFCYEAGLPLTVENARIQPKHHPRCGTSFLIIVMLISILFFMVVRVDNVLLRMASRIILVPVIAGVSYEFLRLAGRSDNPIVNLLSKPGLWMQNLTTSEPDNSMIEVAIAAVEAVFDWKAYLRENFPDTEIPEDRSDAAVSGPAQDQAISREEAR